MFTESFFSVLLGLKDGWEVKSVSTDLEEVEIAIEVECLLKEIPDPESNEMCKVYDHAPMRRWRHLGCPDAVRV